MVLVIALAVICAASTAGYCIEITDVKVLLNGESVGDVSYPGIKVHATPFTIGDTVEVQVTVRGRNEAAFVGATITDSDGNELDFRVWRVSLGANALGLAVSETGTLSVTIPGDRFTQPSVLRLTVRLWERIVHARKSNGELECQRIDPSDGRPPCKYCRRNGYHLEGPIGRPWEKTLGPYLAYRQ